MSSPTCPVHGTKLTYPIVPRVSMYGCADCFRDTPFSSWQLTDAPAPLAFDASLDALDVENVRYPEGFAIEIIGLDAVRAAHRAEVERAVAEERSRNLDVLADFYSKTRAGYYASLSNESRQARLDVLTRAYSRMGGGMIHERADELDRVDPIDGIEG